MRDGIFSKNYGIVNLHPSRGTHWVKYIKDCYFDSNGISPPEKLPKYLRNRHGNCIYSEYQTQKNDSLCASFCLYIVCLTKIEGLDFKSAVLNNTIK